MPLLFGPLLVGVGCGESQRQSPDTNQGTGGLTDRERYADVARYYPIEKLTRQKLPAQASLERYAPTPRHQGSQGSCVGWAVGYCARTMLEARRLNADPDSIAFSPSYVYNQVRVEDCYRGSYLSDALLLMQREGLLTLSEFPYRKQHCDVLPDENERIKAHKYRIEGFARLSEQQKLDRIDLRAIQQHIAQGLPVVVLMLVNERFKTLSRPLWEPNSAERAATALWRTGDPAQKQATGHLGHAMTIVGYDEFKYGGAFRLQNSWGEDFGDGGRFWVKNEDLYDFVLEAYAIYPQPLARSEQQAAQVQLNLGLSTAPIKRYLSFSRLAEDRFKLDNELKPGMKFHLELSNSAPLYLTIIGRDAGGLPYIIYPADTSQSSYVGVAGTRRFPSNGVFFANETTGREWVYVLLSPSPIDAELYRKRLVGESVGQIKRQLFRDRRLGRIRKATADELVSLDSRLKEGQLIIIELILPKPPRS
ncbi:MAG: C1 family peptidase [Bacteroidota bacterium]